MPLRGPRQTRADHGQRGSGTIYQNPDGYDRYMGRWSARLAPLFLDFCDLDGMASCLDVGCGTGALTKAVRARYGEALVVGIDPAKEFIEGLRPRLDDGGAFFCRGEAQALPFADACFDAVLGLLILQQMPDRLHVVREMARASRAGGTVATAIWNFATGMPMFSIFWDAVEAVDPAAADERRANKTGPLIGPSEDSLAALWQDSGLADVRAATLKVSRDYDGLADFWEPFLSNATPSSSVAGKMDQETRAALKEEIRARLLGGREDRPFSLTAEAFAVCGRVPAG